MIATLKKTRGILMHHNIDKKLADALAEVRRLNLRYAAINNDLAKRVDLTYFDKRVTFASAEYARSQSPEDLERLVLAEMVLEPAQERIAGLRRAFAYGNAVFQQFANEFSTWRAVLATACELKLQSARAELERVTAAERERLGDEFDDEELADSPVVKRADSAVRQWHSRLAGIANAPDWSSAVRAVLDDK
jgi:hypothetical protein